MKLADSLNTPVTGGNVSFYNESPDTTVYPTPVIGMIGLIKEPKNITTSYFKNCGDKVFLLGEDFEEIGGSEYLSVEHNLVTGNCPKIDLQKEKELHTTLLNLIDKGIINSAHDISDGGIISALAECCIINNENRIGVQVNIPIKTREDFSFFSESQSRVIISVSKENEEDFLKSVKSCNTPHLLLGETGGVEFVINEKYKFSIDKLSEIYFESIPKLMNE